MLWSFNRYHTSPKFWASIFKRKQHQIWAYRFPRASLWQTYGKYGRYYLRLACWVNFQQRTYSNTFLTFPAKNKQKKQTNKKKQKKKQKKHTHTQKKKKKKRAGFRYFMQIVSHFTWMSFCLLRNIGIKSICPLWMCPEHYLPLDGIFQILNLRRIWHAQTTVPRVVMVKWQGEIHVTKL